jgi:hypothetical protein
LYATVSIGVSEEREVLVAFTVDEPFID